MYEIRIIRIIAKVAGSNDQPNLFTFGGVERIIGKT